MLTHCISSISSCVESHRYAESNGSLHGVAPDKGQPNEARGGAQVAKGVHQFSHCADSECARVDEVLCRETEWERHAHERGIPHGGVVSSLMKLFEINQVY